MTVPNTDRFAHRRDKLRHAVIKHELDGLLVTNFSNVTYLTGFTGDSSYLLLTRTGELVISDFRYVTQLDDECPTLDRFIRKPDITVIQAAAKVLKRAKLPKVGIESTSLTVFAKEVLQKALPRTEIVSTANMVEGLRQVKDASEVAAIRQAIRQAERAFAVLRATIRGDQTEKQVADQLEMQIRQLGAKQTSFTPIVAVGPKAALPHYRPGNVRIDASACVLIDWGADEGLYKSDLTRLLVTGRIPPKLETVYGVVLTAQRRAIEAIRPGRTCHDVDAVARGVIEKAGFGRRFGHALGHGVGLDIHEAPRVGPSQKQLLQAGMVVTVEPGIYLPNHFGVRIEDDVLVTKDGCEVLSTLPKEFGDAVIN
jgi:Xaa-Pro aminopeptidase